VTDPQSKSDALYDRMRDDILVLALAPDAPLRLPALSERYGFGLTPLRECLHRLCGDQLVVPEHNKGFRVSPLTGVDLLDLERSRNAVEGAMFANAVTHADDAWEAAVVGAYHHLSQTHVPAIIQDDASLALWTRRHAAFHRALVAGSQSTWMQRFAGQLDDQLGRYQRFIQTALRDLAKSAPHIAAQAETVFATAMAIEPHRALYDAALARDTDAARAAFDQHTKLSITAFEGLTALMPEGFALATTLGPQTQVAQ
jgi:DNA-binding GntR family transcriptional regulator